MRIGLVIENLDPRRGGAEQWTLQFAAQLAAWGHEIHVAAQRFAPAAAAAPIVPHPTPTTPDRLRFAADAAAALAPLRLDVVHDMGAGWYGAVFASHDGSRIAQWEQRFARLPFWLRPAKRLLSHLLPRYREFRRLMARQFADPRRIVVAMSRMVADDFQRYHGVRPEQIRLVYHGIDAARFAPQHCRPLRGPMRAELGLADDEAALLFVGHDFARKGLATAIRATAQLVRAGRPARLLVVGRDRRQPLYAMLAHACGVGRQVAFVPACDDPRPYYAAADALVLPTYYDPFGLVVLEAAGCGLPVLTTRQAGVSELMTDGLEGFVLPEPADCRLLAERLQTVLEPGGREAMGAAARQLAQRHTFARNCKDILAIYQELTAARRAAA